MDRTIYRRMQRVINPFTITRKSQDEKWTNVKVLKNRLVKRRPAHISLFRKPPIPCTTRLLHGSK